MSIAHSPSARRSAALAVMHAARQYPDLEPMHPPVGALPPREAGLAVAITRTVAQRWITLEFLLNKCTRRPMDRLEDSMRAVLLTGAAQLLFMDRMPLHAIVDESVELAKSMVRRGPGAAGLVNAVLRKLAGMVEQVVHQQAWEPSPSKIPTDDGFVLLPGALPAVKTVDEHLSVATSHPRKLVQRWIERFGVERTSAMCRRNVMTPPIFVTDGSSSALWQGTHTQLLEHLAADPRRRVQDPTAAMAVDSLRGSDAKVVVDVCAGRGTKTRQLRDLLPGARIIASDASPDRVTDLLSIPGIEASSLRDLAATVGPGGADVILLDVPCSNTGVLARRPEARYRCPANLESLLELQRGIVRHALEMLAPNGQVLYSTCSIENDENERQARWIAQVANGRIERESATLPEGLAELWHDGGYFAHITVG